MNPLIPHHKVVVFARISIISESEVSITIICHSLPFFVVCMFTLLHNSTNQELSEKYICNHSSHYE